MCRRAVIHHGSLSCPLASPAHPPTWPQPGSEPGEAARWELDWRVGGPQCPAGGTPDNGPLFPIVRPRASVSGYQPALCPPRRSPGICHRGGRTRPSREPHSTDATPENRNESGQHALLPLPLQSGPRLWGLGLRHQGWGVSVLQHPHLALSWSSVARVEASLGPKAGVPCFPQAGTKHAPLPICPSPSPCSQRVHHGGKPQRSP